MPLPFVPGVDGAGEIVAVGEDVHGFSVGGRTRKAAATQSHLFFLPTFHILSLCYAVET